MSQNPQLRIFVGLVFYSLVNELLTSNIQGDNPIHISGGKKKSNLETSGKISVVSWRWTISASMNPAYCF